MRFSKCKGNPDSDSFLTVPTLRTELDSMSFCFRFNIEQWSYGIHYLKSSNIYLYISSYNHGTGIFSVVTDESASNVNFVWKGVLSMSPTTWNSLCLSYDASNKWMIVGINGVALFNSELSMPNIPGKFNMSFIEIGKTNNFRGYFTDFNIWSKPLSLEDIAKYSSQDLSKITLYPKPDVLGWSDANITLRNNCTRLVEQSSETISLRNALVKKKEYFLFANEKSFEKTTEQCGQINGQIFYPKTKDQLKLILNLYKDKLTKHCSNKIWGPFKKSSANSTKWETGRKWEKQGPML